MNGRFGDFTGHLDRDPRVRFVNDEARSFVARSPDRFGTDPDLAHRHLGGDGGRRVRAQRELALHRRGVDDVSAASHRRRHAERVALVLPRPPGGDVPDDDARRRGAARGSASTDPRRHIAIVRNMTADATASTPTRPTASARFWSAGSRSPTPSSTRSIAKPRALQFEVPFSPRGDPRPDVRRS